MKCEQAEVGIGSESDNATKTRLTQGQARSELEEFLHSSEERRRLFPHAALVGVLVGVVAVTFRIAIGLVESLRGTLITYAHHNTRFGWMIPVLFTTALALVAITLTQHYAPEAKGAGVPHLKAVLFRYREVAWKRLLLVKFFAGILSIGSGLVLGREGPTIQMGGAGGKAIADWLHAPRQEEKALIAAGAGAGLAAAFNAPLAGLLFVLEELQRDFRANVFGATLLATTIADVIARTVGGQQPVILMPAFALPALRTLPIMACVGILCGLLGVFFNKGMLYVLAQKAKLSPRAKLLVNIAIAALLGWTAWVLPTAVGSGHTLTENALAGNIALRYVPTWLVLRFMLTFCSYSTGAPGGMFAPMLVLGALLGLGVGQASASLMPHMGLHPEVFAVAGMAAFFTASIRAPLTGVILIVEMTGNYSLLLSLLICCFSAYAVAEKLKDLPLYEALLERELLDGSELPQPTEPIVIEVEVEPTSHFEGKLVSELGLPMGCILVRCYLDGRELVPTATTRLERYMRLMAILAPEVIHAAALLREGCASNA